MQINNSVVNLGGMNTVQEMHFKGASKYLVRKGRNIRNFF